jgi:hypothetical protein
MDLYNEKKSIRNISSARLGHGMNAPDEDCPVPLRLAVHGLIRKLDNDPRREMMR